MDAMGRKVNPYRNNQQYPLQYPLSTQMDYLRRNDGYFRMELVEYKPVINAWKDTGTVLTCLNDVHEYMRKHPLTYPNIYYCKFRYGKED